MKENDYEKELLFKVKTFKKLKFKIHISKKDGSWKNGEIKKVSEKYFILDEKKEGEIPIFFDDIKPNGITKFTEPKNG